MFSPQAFVCHLFNFWVRKQAFSEIVVQTCHEIVYFGSRNWRLHVVESALTRKCKCVDFSHNVCMAIFVNAQILFIFTVPNSKIKMVSSKHSSNKGKNKSNQKKADPARENWKVAHILLKTNVSCQLKKKSNMSFKPFLQGLTLIFWRMLTCKNLMTGPLWEIN